jgi:hypothetical protein
MALWAIRTSKALCVRRVAILPWAAGLSLAAAMLVPVVFECFDKYSNPETIKTGLTRAAVILCVTAALCPWTSLKIDLSSGIVRWRRRRLLSLHSKEVNSEQIARVERLKRPNLGCCARNVVRLHGESASLVQPLGWSFDAESQARIDRLADEIERLVLSPEMPAPPAAPEPLPRRRWQISIRRLMLAMFAAAAALGLARLAAKSTSDAALPGALTTALMAVAGVMLFRWGEPALERLLTLLLVLYGPFAWIVEVSPPWGRTSGMWSAFLFIPNSFIVVHLTPSPSRSLWLAAAVTLVEFVFLIWCARRGWKWTLSAAAILGLVSSFLSLAAYAGYRM